MSDFPRHDLPSDEEVAGDQGNAPAPLVPDAEQSQGRGLLTVVLLGLARFAIAMAFPLLLVVILALVAQAVISGH